MAVVNNSINRGVILNLMAILHGGQLNRIAKQYQIPESQWLDLSTGIAPFSYPIPDIPGKYWQQLPTIPESLIDAAKAYYNAQYCWPLAGSQQLIGKLPQLWLAKQHLEKNNLETNVYLPRVGYKEHQHAWEEAGYQLHFYQQTLPTKIEKGSVVVVINPNNPLTDIFSIEQLKALEKQCQQQQSLLIIDEAFTDIFSPELSFVSHLNNKTENVLVLRSFGKFFGLAGVRIGFVCCTQSWCEVVKLSVGPWAINGPAIYISELALKDTQWQIAQRKRLNKQSQLMLGLLKKHLPRSRIESNDLFITVFADHAPDIYHQLCQLGVYVRLTDENNALRFGIADEKQLERLAASLLLLDICNTPIN